MIIDDDWKACLRTLFVVTMLCLAACLVRGCATEAFASAREGCPMDEGRARIQFTRGGVDRHAQGDNRDCHATRKGKISYRTLTLGPSSCGICLHPSGLKTGNRYLSGSGRASPYQAGPTSNSIWRSLRYQPALPHYRLGSPGALINRTSECDRLLSSSLGESVVPAKRTDCAFRLRTRNCVARDFNFSVGTTVAFRIFHVIKENQDRVRTIPLSSIYEKEI